MRSPWPRLLILEDVAALLWAMPRERRLRSGRDGSTRWPRGPSGRDGDLMTRFAASTREDETAAWVADPTRLAAGCGALVRNLAACILGGPSAEPIHPPDRRGLAARCGGRRPRSRGAGPLRRS